MADWLFSRGYFYFFSDAFAYTGRFFIHRDDMEQGGTQVEELAQWLKSQHKGLRTYKTFQQRVLDLGTQDRDHYALYYLLGTLVGRFVDAYDESPLTLDVTDEAHKRLVALSDKAAHFDELSSDDRLAFLNEIATSELN
ncbi:MAG TPA: hypothetical protein VNQ56_15540 [Pseudolabrys sp.]|nr:hypothetical protein [Pseudolabrys sp.]